MTRFIAAGFGVVFSAAAAFGQGFPTTTVTVPAPVNPFGTPGRAVGRPSAVGTPVALAATPAGTPIGFSGPGGMPAQTQRPPGKLIDLSNLAAPLTAPLPPGLVDGPAGNLLDRIYERWASMIGFTKPAAAQMGTANAYTPGISRRNRDRSKIMWWRD